MADPEARAVSEVLVATELAAVFISRAETLACLATPSAPIPPRVDKADWEARAVAAESVAVAAWVVRVPSVNLHRIFKAKEETVEPAA